MERRVRFVQPLVIRLSHWLHAVLLLGLIASGLQIFGAYPSFAERGADFCCYPFAGKRFPEAVRLGGWLAGGLKWHLFLMWPFVLNGLVWVGYLLGSGEWRRRLFLPRDARGAWEMMLYYLRLRRDKPRYDLERLPRTTLRLRHYCIEGWTAVASWTGVRLAELARIAGADPDADYVDFRSFDVGYWSSWDRESALHPQSLIAYGMNGHYLTPGHGAPARLYSNLKYGYKSVKYLTSIRFLRERTGGFWEDRGYDWYAGL